MSTDILSNELYNAETGVLGSMLIDPAVAGSMLAALEDSDFRTPARRMIFQAYRRRYTAGLPVDAMLVGEDLGGAYSQQMAEMVELTPTSANAREYAAALKRTSRLFQLRELGERLGQAADEEECRSLIDQANLLLCQRSGVRRLTMEQGFREFFIRHDAQKKPDHLRWGIPKLDEEVHVGGGDMVVIGGYASAGKTALALQLAFQIAQKKRVGFFSYETSADKLYDRMAACQTQTSFRRMMTGTLETDDYRRIYDSKQHLTSPVMDFVEASGMTVSSVGSYAMAHRYDVVLVDYLQKLPAARSGRYLSDFERVSQVSSDLQQLGRRTGMTVIALSQLSRAEKGSEAPTMSSLRQSGQIEQDADVVMLLYKEFPKEAVSRRCLDIAKNKDGLARVGALLEFDGNVQRFRQSSAKFTPPPKPEPPAQQSIFRPVPDNTPSPWEAGRPPGQSLGQRPNDGPQDGGAEKRRTTS